MALENGSGKCVSHDLEVECCDAESSHSDGVPNRAGVRSAPSHFCTRENENLTEKLLENSGEWSFRDDQVFESMVVDDWSEAASGWGLVVPYPKYVVQQQPSLQLKSQSAVKKGSVSSDGFCPSWNGNVEPVTYRYMPNNGCYRNHKLMQDLREWPVVRKIKSEKTHMTPEIYHSQKTLKRDLENSFRNSGEDSISTHNAPDTTVKLGTEERDCISEARPLTRHLTKYDQQQIKSASDLFVEKFNTRLSALERELQIPRVPVVSKKPAPESSSAPNHSPRHLSKKFREMRGQEAMKQNSKQHGSDFGEDLFTVIPVCKPEVPLRPLEKLTPKQKHMEKSSASQEGFSSTEVQSGEKDEDMIILACATSHPPSLPKDPDITGINTVRTAVAKTNSAIEKMRNTSLRSEFNSNKLRARNHKEGGGVAGRGTMSYTAGGSSSISQPSNQTSPLEGIDRKESLPSVDRLGSMSSALPEIMGKRLSFIVTTHRLL